MFLSSKSIRSNDDQYVCSGVLLSLHERAADAANVVHRRDPHSAREDLGTVYRVSIPE